MDIFTKELSLNKIIEIMSKNNNHEDVSQAIIIYKNVQEHLQEIYDFGFKKGYENCMKVSENLKEI